MLRAFWRSVVDPQHHHHRNTNIIQFSWMCQEKYGPFYPLLQRVQLVPTLHWHRPRQDCLFRTFIFGNLVGKVRTATSTLMLTAFCNVNPNTPNTDAAQARTVFLRLWFLIIWPKKYGPTHPLWCWGRFAKWIQTRPAQTSPEPGLSFSGFDFW